MLESFLIMSNKSNSNTALIPKNFPLVKALHLHNPVIENAFSGSIDCLSFADQGLFSSDTKIIANSLKALRNPTSPAFIASTNPNKSTEELLFDATSSAKVMTSQVAMHLDANFRKNLFSQIDYLHDHNDWDPDDKPVQMSSFKTFLRTILHIKPKRNPGLGLSFGGNLIAAWTTNRDRLTVEFLDNDKIKFVLSKYYENDDVERSSAQTNISRLSECLAPYKPESWFD